MTMTTDNTLPWTRKEFMKQLRTAGWSRTFSNLPIYRHPDGGKVDLDEVFWTGQGKNKRLISRCLFWCEKRQTPATSEPPF